MSGARCLLFLLGCLCGLQILAAPVLCAEEEDSSHFANPEDWDKDGWGSPAPAPEDATAISPDEAIAQAEQHLDLLPLGQAADTVLDYKPAPPAKNTADLLAEIMARPEFQLKEEEEQESWLDKVAAWLSKLLSRLHLGSPGWLGQGTGTLLIWGIFLCLVLLITRLVWGWVAQRQRMARGSVAAAELPSRPAELLEQARAAFARGDLRAALRLRFRAVIAALELPSSALQTNSQLCRIVKREAPSAAEPFLRLCSTFEDVWYGGQACSAPTYQQADELAQAVEAALSQAASERKVEAA